MGSSSVAEGCTPFTEGQTLSLYGQIFQGKMLAGEGEGGAWEPERKYMAINLYPEICFSGDDHKYSMLEVAIPENWLGHDVVIIGKMEGCLDGYCVDVKSVKNYEERADGIAPAPPQNHNPCPALYSMAGLLGGASMQCNWPERRALTRTIAAIDKYCSAIPEDKVRIKEGISNFMATVKRDGLKKACADMGKHMDD
jgi:hypothetical protein